jgi:hypothetical protein
MVTLKLGLSSSSISRVSVMALSAIATFVPLYNGVAVMDAVRVPSKMLLSMASISKLTEASFGKIVTALGICRGVRLAPTKTGFAPKNAPNCIVKGFALIISRIRVAIAILPNEASVSFEILAIDNNILEGTRTASITATPLYNGTNVAIADKAITETLDILDDESPSLSVAIDRSIIAETGTATATITRNTNTDNPLTVNLTSSDTTEATIPNTVIIPVGETSVTAIISGVNDGVSDGSQPVTISASATGLNGGSATLDVSDIEVPDLVLTQLNANSPAYSDKLSQFTYKVENLGLQNLSGTWSDRVYLSTDTILYANDE